jgi:hypothetical protein
VGVCWTTPRPGHIAPRKDSLPFLVVGGGGGDTGPVWKDMENFASNGIRPRTVQPVAIRDTSYAIPTNSHVDTSPKFNLDLLSVS